MPKIYFSGSASISIFSGSDSCNELAKIEVKYNFTNSGNSVLIVWCIFVSLSKNPFYGFQQYPVYLCFSARFFGALSPGWLASEELCHFRGKCSFLCMGRTRFHFSCFGIAGYQFLYRKADWFGFKPKIVCCNFGAHQHRITGLF